MSEYKLSASVRTVSGKGASRRLRKAGLVPCIIYGNNFEPISIETDAKALNRLLNMPAILSKIITIETGKASHSVLLKALQKHPYKPLVMHVDFLHIDENALVDVRVPIEFVNESKCFGVKNQGGMITHYLNEIELRASAKKIPERIVVDMENVKIAETIHIGDLAVPQGCIVVELLKGKEHNLVVAKVSSPDESSYDTPEAIETENTKVSKEEAVSKDKK